MPESQFAPLHPVVRTNPRLPAMVLPAGSPSISVLGRRDGTGPRYPTGHARPRLPLCVPKDPALGDLSCLFRRLGLPKLLECLVNVVGDVSSKAACAGYRCKAPGINEPRRSLRSFSEAFAPSRRPCSLHVHSARCDRTRSPGEMPRYAW